MGGWRYHPGGSREIRRADFGWRTVVHRVRQTLDTILNFISHGDLTDRTSDALGHPDLYLREKGAGGVAAELPEHDHSSAAQAGTVAHASTTGQTVNDHHNQDHKARHEENGADELLVESLGTAETDVGKYYRPDGTGGVIADTLPASGGGGISEVPLIRLDDFSNETDGARTEFELLDIADIEHAVAVWLNGLLQLLTTDYSVATDGTSITMVVAPLSGDQLQSQYSGLVS